MRYLLSLICFILFIPKINFGQLDSAIMLKDIPSNKVVTEQTGLFFSKVENYVLDDLAREKFVPVGNILSHFKDRNEFLRNNIYLRLSLNNNDTGTADILLFFGGNIRSVELFEQKEGKVLPISFDEDFNGYLPIKLKPSERGIYFAKIQFPKTKRTGLKPTIIRRSFLTQHQALVQGYFADIKITSFVTCGMILMMVFLSMLNFSLRAKREYLLYTAYALSIFLIVFGTNYYFNRQGIFAASFFEYIDLFLMIIGLIFYVGFKVYFFNLPKAHPRLYKFVLIELYFTIFCFLAAVVLIVFDLNYNLFFLLEELMKVIMILLGITFVVLSFREKNKFINYFNYGYIIALILWILSLGIIMLGVTQTNILNSPIIYYQFGFVASLVGYLLSLNYKARQTLIQSIEADQERKIFTERIKFEGEIAIIKAQDEERRRISADMHDDLGAGMTSIRLYTELAKNKIKENIPELDKISKNANEVLEKMNAIIWSMNSGNDTLENMVAYIRSYMIEFFDESPIKVRVKIPHYIPYYSVGGQTRRNVFLVVREALNNIVKHSQATEVQVELIINAEIVQLVIHDNGVGVDLSLVNRFGNGLRNMKKRMEDSDVDFFIENRNGTYIRMTRIIK